jgi:hypothetical protein
MIDSEECHQWVRDRKGKGVEVMEGNLNGNHLRLIPIPGLCLEDRTN